MLAQSSDTEKGDALGRSHGHSGTTQAGVSLDVSRDAWNCACPAGFVNLSSSSCLSWQLMHCICLLCTSSLTLWKGKKESHVCVILSINMLIFRLEEKNHTHFSNQHDKFKVLLVTQVQEPIKNNTTV